MPTYEYACKECGEHHEVHQSFSDAPVSECPSCGGPLRKVFGSIAIAFKGSGFYKTDSRTSSANGKAKKDGDRSSSTEGSSPSSSSSPSSTSSAEGSSSSSSSEGSSSGSAATPTPAAASSSG